MQRREFLQVAGTASLSGSCINQLQAAENKRAGEFRGKIYKSVKYGGRVNIKRLKQLKELGFDGVEGSAPGMDVEGLKKACAEVGMPMHGVVYNKHWKMRLSSPDPKVRDIGRKGLEDAIRQSKAVGGSSVLLVPGAVKGKDENHDHVWNRSSYHARGCGFDQSEQSSSSSNFARAAAMGSGPASSPSCAEHLTYHEPYLARDPV